jgi:hypothetical protein
MQATDRQADLVLVSTASRTLADEPSSAAGRPRGRAKSTAKPVGVVCSARRERVSLAAAGFGEESALLVQPVRVGLDETARLPM